MYEASGNASSTDAAKSEGATLPMGEASGKASGTDAAEREGATLLMNEASDMASSTDAADERWHRARSRRRHWRAARAR